MKEVHRHPHLQQTTRAHGIDETHKQTTHATPRSPVSEARLSMKGSCYRPTDINEYENINGNDNNGSYHINLTKLHWQILFRGYHTIVHSTVAVRRKKMADVFSVAAEKFQMPLVVGGIKKTGPIFTKKRREINYKVAKI